ncbi:unnamed protein product [Urochloa humidicola]
MDAHEPQPAGFHFPFDLSSKNNSALSSHSQMLVALFLWLISLLCSAQTGTIMMVCTFLLMGHSKSLIFPSVQQDDGHSFTTRSSTITSARIEI